MHYERAAEGGEREAFSSLPMTAAAPRGLVASPALLLLLGQQSGVCLLPYSLLCGFTGL